MSLRRDDDAVATAFEIPARRWHGWNYNYLVWLPESWGGGGGFFSLLRTMIYTRWNDLTEIERRTLYDLYDGNDELRCILPFFICEYQGGAVYDGVFGLRGAFHWSLGGEVEHIYFDSLVVGSH